MLVSLVSLFICFVPRFSLLISHPASSIFCSHAAATHKQITHTVAVFRKGVRAVQVIGRASTFSLAPICCSSRLEVPTYISTRLLKKASAFLEKKKIMLVRLISDIRQKIIILNFLITLKPNLSIFHAKW